MRHRQRGCGIGLLSDLVSVSVRASAQTSHPLETKPKTFLPLTSLELLLGFYAKRNDQNSGLTRILFSLHKFYPMQVIKEGSGVGGLGCGCTEKGEASSPGFLILPFICCLLQGSAASLSNENHIFTSKQVFILTSQASVTNPTRHHTE